MNTQNNLRNYERIMAVVIAAIALTMFLASCTTQRRSNYQDHLRSAPTQNWVRHDNGGCGWHN